MSLTVSSFTVAFSRAFKEGFLDFDAFSNAVANLYDGLFDSMPDVECYDIAAFEGSLNFLYLQCWAYYKTNSHMTLLTLSTMITRIIDTSLIHILWENTATDWVSEAEYEIDGLTQLTAEGADIVRVILAEKIARTLIDNDALAMYYDIALSYRYGNTVNVLGNDFKSAVIYISD